MKVPREIGLVLFLLVSALFFADSAVAMPEGDKSLHDSLADVAFIMGAGSAELDCEVYNYTSGLYVGKYLYSYQISNVDSGIGLKFFSVGIIDGAIAYDCDFDSVVGCVDPVLWAVSNSTLQSVDATFTDAIINGESSAILWYISDYGPAPGEGALYGTASGIPYYATAEVLSPMPEPATLLLLGSGGVLIVVARRRRHV